VPSHNGKSLGQRAVFLDRDGTINEEVDYLHRVEDLQLIKGAAEGISLLNRDGFKVIVVTNQSGVARGYFQETDVHMIHKEMELRLSRAGASVDGWYYCPHHPDYGTSPYRARCGCRKPETGMIEKACKDFEIDVAASFVIGDSACDIELALSCGARPILVLTGHGKKTYDGLSQVEKKKLYLIASDLYEACRCICGY